MAQQKKIAVLVSGGGTNLQALIDAEKRGELGAGKITLVIASKPGVYALERAANAGIEGRVLARKDYDSIAAYSKALADEMTAAGIDLVVLAGFLTIITIPAPNMGIKRMPMSSHPSKKEREPAGRKISRPTRITPRKNLKIACANSLNDISIPPAEISYLIVTYVDRICKCFEVFR